MPLTPDERVRRLRIYQLFGKARRIEPAARELYLQNACPDDPTLRAEVIRRIERGEAGGNCSGRDGSSSGTLLEDDYELRDEIGRGGMGIVYRAHQKSLNRPVAIKMLLAGPYSSESDLQRFEMEAKAAAQLNHQGVVPIYQVGHEGRRHWIAMKLIDGPSLQYIIDRQSLAPMQAAEYTKAIAEAVAHAHAHGIIHRDLKPANILLDHQGQPVVTDFGLAKHIEEDRNLSITGQVMGSAGYMAPEQAVGKPSEINIRTDVYALGAVLYALLTGKPLFESRSIAEATRRVIDEEPMFPRPMIHSIPADLQTICLKCLQKNPTQRYGSAEEVADELGRFLGGEPIEARPLGTMAKAWRWCRRKPWIAGLAAAVLLSLVSGTVVSTYFAVHANQQASEARRNAELFAEAKTEADEQAAEAQRSATEARRHAYAVQMSLAQISLDDGDIERAWSLLNAQWPYPGEEDLRGFDWYCLAHQLQSELTAFQGHRDRIVCVAASPQQPVIATGGIDHDIWLWDVKSGHPLNRLIGHTEVVYGLAFSPDGAVLVSASGDRTVRLWDVRFSGEARELRRFDGGDIPFLCVDISPDGTWLAAGQNEDVILWELASDHPGTVLKGHSGSVRGLRFSPCGQILATASSDHTVRIWEVESGREVIVLADHAHIVHSVDFSPDGSLLATGSWDGNARLWETATWKLSRLRKTTGMVRAVAFSPNGGQVAFAGEAHEINVWGLADGEIRTLKGHQGMVWGLAFTPHDGTLVSVAESSRAASDGSPHGRSGEIKTWNPETGTEMPPHRERTQQRKQIFPLSTWTWRIALSPDGKQVFAAQEDGVVTAWDIETGEQAGQFIGHEARIRTLEVSPDANLLVTGSDDHTVRLWHIPTGKQVHVLPSGTTSLQFSSDGRLLATAVGPSVLLWRVSTGERHQLLMMPGESQHVVAVAWSLDGRHLATGCNDGSIALWDVERGEIDIHWTGPQMWLHDIAVSPDGRFLATAGKDGTACLWAVVDGTLLNTFRGHHNEVTAVAFTPGDGRRLATASMDRTLKMWDVTTGHELITLRDHGHELCDLKFSSDGRSLAVGIKGVFNDLFGQIELWRSAAPDDLFEITRQRAQRHWGRTEDQLAFALCCWNLSQTQETSYDSQTLLATGREVLQRLQSASPLSERQQQLLDAMNKTSIPPAGEPISATVR